MPQLTVMVPSRGRPENILRLRDAFIETCTAETELVVYVDKDDPNLSEYQALEGVNLVVGTPSRIGPLLNYHAPKKADESFALGFMGDDHVPRTIGWDTTILDKLRLEGAGVAYGNDLLQGERLCTAVVLTSNIVQVLGYFALPGALHLFLDNFWMSIGRGINKLFYFEDVVIEHLHPAAGKTEWDDGYVVANSTTTWSADEAAYNRYMQQQYFGDIDNLKKNITGL